MTIFGIEWNFLNPSKIVLILVILKLKMQNKIKIIKMLFLFLEDTKAMVC